MRTNSLFPILQAQPIGLVRMAADSEHADHGHDVEFRTLETRSILTKSVSKRQLWMAYSINPYRGCEFGCRYCYARYTHGFMAGPGAEGANAELADPESFERKIFIKQNAAWLLEQELRKVGDAREIALGTATDPYQPIERRAKVTRSLLEVFARKEGLALGIVTKSTLIERDIDLLQKIAERNTLVLHITITTAEIKLARLLEPRAPRPDLRLETVRRLRDAGLVTGILCCPLMPGINDSAAAIDRMAARAAEAKASFFAAQPLFLKSCSRPTFLSFVREHFPALQADYAERFNGRDFAEGPYKRLLAARVSAACRKHGLAERSSDALLTRDVGEGKKPVASVPAPRQAMLFAS